MTLCGKLFAAWASAFDPVRVDHVPKLRRLCLLLALASHFLIVGCSTKKSISAYSGSDIAMWNGRISLLTFTVPPQRVTVSFLLQGSPERGELALYSPLGNTIALARWSPGKAELQQGPTVQQFVDLDTLTEAISGSPLPVVAMFSWLEGQNVSANGWVANLDDLPAGRLQARRESPEPVAEMRIVLDQIAD